AFYFHQLGSRFFIITAFTFIKAHLPRIYLLCGINKVAVSKPCSKRSKLIRRKGCHLVRCRKGVSAVYFFDETLTMSFHNTLNSFYIVVLRNDKGTKCLVRLLS